MVGESLLGGTLASPTALGHGPGSWGQWPSPYVDGGGGYRLGGGRATGTPVSPRAFEMVFLRVPGGTCKHEWSQARLGCCLEHVQGSETWDREPGRGCSFALE